MKKTHYTEVKALPEYNPPVCALHLNAALSSLLALSVRVFSCSAEEGLGPKGPLNPQLLFFPLDLETMEEQIRPDAQPDATLRSRDRISL